MTLPNARSRGVRLTLLAAVFLPSLVMMVTHGSSMASGLLLSVGPALLSGILLVLLRSSSQRLPVAALIGAVLISNLLLLHYLAAGLVLELPQDGKRFGSSLAAMLALCGAAYVVALSLRRLNDAALKKTVSVIMFIFLLNGALALTGADFFGGATSKPTFLFSEPSHLALACAPFLIFHVRARLTGWLGYLLFFFLWALYIENATMLAVLAATVVVGFRLKAMFLLLPVCIGLFAAFADLDYFASRLVLSVDDANLSGLVLMQGWQNAFLTLIDSKGLGAGFQQFGIASATGDVTARVNELFGADLNLFDGGTTASKLVGEFGVFGIDLVLLMMGRAALALRAIKRKHAQPEHALQLLAHCTSVGFMVELLLRGVGYFSPGVFLYLTMFFYTLNCRRGSIQHA